MNNHASYLKRVQIGMPIYDKYGQKIGQVIRVCINENLVEVEDEIEKNTTIPADDPEWLELVANIIEPDDSRGIALARELWEKGFIKIGGGGFIGFQRYVLPTQIEKIDDEGVHLNVSR